MQWYDSLMMVDCESKRVGLFSVILWCKYLRNVQHFNNQMTHTTLENVELIKHSKISKTAPTCFGLQGNHHQGATVST